jgi:hypothetical protein
MRMGKLAADGERVRRRKAKGEESHSRATTILESRPIEVRSVGIELHVKRYRQQDATQLDTFSSESQR